jgi:hypothetical protein
VRIKIRGIFFSIAVKIGGISFNGTRSGWFQGDVNTKLKVDPRYGVASSLRDLSTVWEDHCEDWGYKLQWHKIRVVSW